MSVLKTNSIQPTTPGSEDYFLSKAWVNFNGTGTVAIRGDGNVTSITDNAVGDYTTNFTVATVDANYAAIPYGKRLDNSTVGSSTERSQAYVHTKTTSSFQLIHCDGNASTLIDPVISDVVVFR